MEFNNNPKVRNGKRINRYRWLWPTPHGAYKTHIEEFFTFRKRRWIMDFENAGFEVVNIIKGPVVSGYGFGFDKARKVLENLGFASEFAYVIVKKGYASSFSRFFV